MRSFPRPLLEVVGLGSAHGAKELSTSARLAKVAPTRAPAPTGYSRAKSAAVGAAVGAALSGATIVGGHLAEYAAAAQELADPDFKDRRIEQIMQFHKKKGDSLTYTRAAEIYDEKRADYLRGFAAVLAARAAKTAAKVAVVGAIGGGAAGFVYASDQNASNLATKRGEPPMGGGKRFAKAAAAFSVAASAAGLLDRAARAKFGTSDADLEHRKPRGAVGVRRPFV